MADIDEIEQEDEPESGGLDLDDIALISFFLALGAGILAGTLAYPVRGEDFATGLGFGVGLLTGSLGFMVIYKIR